MGNHKTLEVLRVLQTMNECETYKNNVEEELEKIEKEFYISSQHVKDLYDKMQAFQMEVESMGGMSFYESSNVTWLKSELELLFAAYQFCQQYGVKVSEISSQLSKKHLNVFPKTESQLQNTYYKLKKEEMLFETTLKQKPGRKRKDPGEMKAKTKTKVVETRKEKKQNTSSDLVSLVSGIVENFETISEKTEKKEQLHSLMEGIYNLSTMAATRTKEENNAGHLQREIEALREENRRLQQKKEEMLVGMNDITSHLIHFITSSDIEQIRSLPDFVKSCKEDLNNLGLYNGSNDANMKVIANGLGHVVSVTQ
ncbi:DNA-binding domain-containing protein [Bacillus manliponensis]|uniref:DNA-binding domain-containing protein n=1 Tax=Bacillus manliponensis TaxID=574376 RepID=UPI0035116BB1